MERQGGLGFAAVLGAGAILVAPSVKPAWLMGLIVILFSLVLWRFFATKYLSYSFCVIAVLYGVTLLPLFVFSCTLAMLVLGELVFQRGADDFDTYVHHIISTSWPGVLVIAYLKEHFFLTVIFG